MSSKPKKGEQFYNIPELTNAHVATGWFDEVGYHPFVGGGGIHPAVPTFEEAEDLIRDYLVARVKREIQTIDRRRLVLEQLQEKLEDPRSMDLFKVREL